MLGGHPAEGDIAERPHGASSWWTSLSRQIVPRSCVGGEPGMRALPWRRIFQHIGNVGRAPRISSQCSVQNELELGPKSIFSCGFVVTLSWCNIFKQIVSANLNQTLSYPGLGSLPRDQRPDRIAKEATVTSPMLHSLFLLVHFGCSKNTISCKT